MRKIFYLILIVGSLIFTVDSCKVDNFPTPDAQVFGAIRDIADGSLVETDLNSGSQVGVWELGQYANNKVRRAWLVKQDGSYRNNLVYSNEYWFELTNCNFFPYNDTLVVHKGANEINFDVTPYIRIRNCQIVLNTTTNQIEATFNLEAGTPAVRVANINLYAWTDIYVGQYVKKQLANATGSSRNLGNAVINPATNYRLTIDLASNQSTTSTGFGVHRNYYFRVAAMAAVPGVTGLGTIRANYAPCVKIAL